MNILETILKAEEGCRLSSYTDTLGFKTIGWGHKFGPDDLTPDPMTQAQADALLLEDIQDAEDDLFNELPWTDGLSDNRQAILCSMTFQMGISGLLKFRKTLAAIQTSNWLNAHDEMLSSDWAKQTPARAKRHAEVMLTDVLPEFYT